MSARNSAKAIVLHEGKILVNRCASRFGDYYALPGGGQQTGEMLSETVKRELLEETGYSVTPIRLSGIYSEWISLKDAHRSNLFPRAIRDNLSGLIGHGETIFIGSEKNNR